MERNVKILALALLLSFCRQEVTQNAVTNQIVAIPGFGLIVNQDTIKLHKTKELDIFRVFKFKDTIAEILIRTGCGFDSEGNSVSIDTYHKTINCDGVVFNFESFVSKDSLKLERIEISDSTNLLVKINDSLVLGKIAKSILKYFPIRSKHDDTTSLWFQMRSYGIDLGLEKEGNHKKLTYISIFNPVMDSK